MPALGIVGTGTRMSGMLVLELILSRCCCCAEDWLGWLVGSILQWTCISLFTLHVLAHSLGHVDKVCCQGRTHVNPTKCQYTV